MSMGAKKLTIFGKKMENKNILGEIFIFKTEVEKQLRD